MKEHIGNECRVRQRCVDVDIHVDVHVDVDVLDLVHVQKSEVK